jgi:arabinofuranosyltransferase
MAKTLPRPRGERPSELIAPPPPQRAVTSGLALVCAGAVTLVAEYVARRFQLGPVDDAYISLRYAANWASGRGLCFNPGEVVEGYTNFLLVVLEAAGIRAGLDPVLLMTLVGRASLAALAALVTGFVYTRVFPRRALLSLAAGLALTLNPVLICWAHSGLESCLYALLLLAAVLAALAADRLGWAIVAAVAVVLAGSTRPEGIVLLPVVLAAAYWRGRRWQPALFMAAIVLVGYGVYFAVRAVHFGYLLPNTFYAKVDYGGPLLALRGLRHVGDFARGGAPLALLVVTAAVLVRWAPLWTRVCLLAAGAQLAVIVYVGGDHFAMFRFLVSVVPFLGLAALYPAVILAQRLAPQRTVASAAIVVTLALVAASGLLVARQVKPGEAPPTTQFARYADECAHARAWTTLGRILRQYAQPNESLATIAVGALGCYSDLTIVDPLGIVDAKIAHQPRRLGAGVAGHEKYDVEYVLSRRPGYLLLVHYVTPEAVPREAVARAAWGDFNRTLATDPRLDAGYYYQILKLGSSYASVFVRRDLPPIR